MIGVFTGRMLVAFQSKPMILLRNLTLVACALLAVGWLWHLVFPVNKSLWTSSFVLVSCGYSILFLAIFYFICDVLKWQKLSKPFMVIGVNAIAIYMASSLVNWSYSSNSLFSGLISYSPDSWQPLLQVSALLMLQMGLLAWMYRQKIFIKI
jgi:predicted acyltransferase